MKTVLETQAIQKYFYSPQKFQVLKDINLQIQQGEFVSISGKSGCGKSTLLYVLSTMDSDFEGELFIDGIEMKGKTEKQLAAVRFE
jgi:lipoprotein-releasing system ATP-binding protein